MANRMPYGAFEKMRTFASRLRGLLGRRRADADFDEELQQHIDLLTQEYLASGMREEEARRRARITLGGVTQLAETQRLNRGVPLLESFAGDLHYAARALRRNPGFAVVAVLSLALGMGASTAVFSVVNAILLKPLPYSHPEDVQVVWRTWPYAASSSGSFPWSPRELRVLLDQPKKVAAVGAFKHDVFNLEGSNDAVRLDGSRVSNKFFATLGVAPALGRAFTAEEDSPGHELEVILSDRIWRERFAGDPGVLGRAITLNGKSYTILGVMPPRFDFPRSDEMPAELSVGKRTDVWVPLALPAVAGGASEIGVLVRTTPGAGVAQTRADMSIFAERLETQFPVFRKFKSGFRIVPLATEVASTVHRPLLLILGAVMLVLLIACANVAGLLVARGLGRQKELSLRAALGADRSRLVRQLLTESLLLATLAGALALAIAAVALRAFRAFGPAGIPRLQSVALDGRVFAFTLLVSIAAAVLFGIPPALGATRSNVADAMRTGDRQVGPTGRSALRSILVAGELALAFVLIVSCTLLVRSFVEMIRSDSGFNPEHVVTFELTLPLAQYSSTTRMTEIYSHILEQMRGMQGVRSAGFASVVPMGGAPDGTAIRIPGMAANADQPPFASYSFASPGYFSAIQASLLQGRDFLDTDTLTSPPVTIINAAMARTYFPGKNPVGMQVGVGDVRWPLRTIIGVVADVKHSSLREQPEPEMYVPYTQNEIKIWPSMQTMQVALRISADPATAIAAARDAVHAVDPTVPISSAATLASLVDASTEQSRFSIFLLGSFAIMALFMAAMGLYGLVAYTVAQRTRDIGIRMALGAQRSQVFRMVLAQGARLSAIGIAAGIVAALAAGRLLTAFLYGVRSSDPATFVMVPAFLASVVVVACYVPARRASRVDPMMALRHE